MSKKQEEKSPSTQDYVRFKAMHANIEAIEYLLKDLTTQIKQAHEHILYNKDFDAIGTMKGFDSSLETMLLLYQATTRLHLTTFKTS